MTQAARISGAKGKPLQLLAHASHTDWAQRCPAQWGYDNDVGICDVTQETLTARDYGEWVRWRLAYKLHCDAHSFKHDSCHYTDAQLVISITGYCCVS